MNAGAAGLTTTQGMWEVLALLLLERLARGSTRTAADAEPVGEQIYYRTRDGLADYAFSIERQRNRSYRVYIAAQPQYGSRPANFAVTHRLSDTSGRHFICWSKAIAHHSQARQVAAAWAEATQRYIQTGQRF